MSKEEYFAKMHAQLEVWQKKLDNLEASIQNTKESAKGEYAKEISELKAKVDSTGNKLDAAKESSSNAWEELKDGIQNSFDELEDGFKAAFHHIRK